MSEFGKIYYSIGKMETIYPLTVRTPEASKIQALFLIVQAIELAFCVYMMSC